MIVRLILRLIEATVPKHAARIPDGLRGSLAPLIKVVPGVVAMLFLVFGAAALRDPDAADRIAGAFVVGLAFLVFILFAHYWTMEIDVTGRGATARSLLSPTKLIRWDAPCTLTFATDGKSLTVQQHREKITLSWMFAGFPELRDLLVRSRDQHSPLRR